jgi:hypothetical protein
MSQERAQKMPLRSHGTTFGSIRVTLSPVAEAVLVV